MKRYLTKWALSEGAKIVEAEVNKYHPRYFSVDGYMGLFTDGRDLQATRREAILRVTDMRNAKIKSLEKQVAKLRALDPEQVVPHE